MRIRAVLAGQQQAEDGAAALKLEWDRPTNVLSFYISTQAGKGWSCNTAEVG